MTVSEEFQQNYLGSFEHSCNTESEQTAYEKYRLVFYYYETECFDRLYCGNDGIPRNDREHIAINRFAKQASKKVVSWKYKKSFCYLSHNEIKQWVDFYEEKYPHFKL